ncbi:hypothetical protein P152DRAFT_412388, partial [Eremomyces bilateralis CBS 781.70]
MEVENHDVKVLDYFTRTANQKRIAEESAAAAAREKFLRRRRIELLRRATEVSWVFLMALAVYWREKDTISLQLSRTELFTYVLLIYAVYTLYPSRLIHHSSKPWWPVLPKLKDSIRVPSAFDPAPLLYPVILPVLVAMSLHVQHPGVLIPNIVLGLSSLPPQIVPAISASETIPYFHWILAVLPLVARNRGLYYSVASGADGGPLHIVDTQRDELLSMLFPLHYTLLKPLAYLTATSLLSSELQLLSTALINLLLFSKSPHATILRILLWGGGLILFVLCKPVIVWAIALARIPRWRFRRAGRVIQARQYFLNRLLGSLRAASKDRTPLAMKPSLDDSDSEEAHTPQKYMGNTIAALELEIANRVQTKLGAFEGDAETKSAVESTRGNDFFPKADLADIKRQRRNTAPNMKGNQSPAIPVRTKKHQRSRSLYKSFLSLTPQQAVHRKWMYACYVYAVIVLTILGPIRLWVQHEALDGHEPFGWAIGYLFGNIRAVRFSVIDWNLERWIPLSPLESSTPTEESFGFAEKIRAGYGLANVRLVLSVYLLSILGAGLLVVLRLSSSVEVDTRRKVFHGTMVAMFLPAIYIDPSFCALALGLVLCIFLLLDVLRASQLPPLSKPIASFLTPFVDGRDLRGPVVVSHLFLLIGCATPLWLSLSGMQTGGVDPWKGWEVKGSDLSMVTGVICVGLGDAAASLVGRRFGRTKWPWTGGKSIEGSVAFAVAVLIGLALSQFWLDVGQWKTGGVDWASWIPKAATAASGASFTEAVLTGGNDNVVVPVVLWLLVRALGI